MKLTNLYPTMDKEARDSLAKAAGIDPGYLWQIATRWRGKKPSIDVIQRLAAADSRLTVGDLVAEFTARPTPKEPANV
ncbi:hypothetical protein [Castellaniella sp.]|uniref:hypothetical protein n=1 Tax=Castellaniella sp. TaxID=1955812 RepID=UPI002AFEC0BD|nr:hypothetical protein [Castellaniella sp.]